jgi:hypothetical protein
MTAAEIAACTDDELQRIVRMARYHDRRFAVERDLAIKEMGRRVADEVLLRAAIKRHGLAHKLNGFFK